MIEVRKKKASTVGSCNFCNRGTVTPNGYIQRPYQKVWVITNGDTNGLEARICKECLSILKSETRK